MLFRDPEGHACSLWEDSAEEETLTLSGYQVHPLARVDARGSESPAFAARQDEI